MLDLAERTPQADRHAARFAFIEQHRDDLLGRAVAEQLPQRLFVKGDAVFFDQRDEISRRVAAQRRFGEVRIGRDIAFRHRSDIGEIAAPAAGNQDLLPHFIGMIDDQYPRPGLPGGGGTHQPGPAAAQDYRIKFLYHRPPLPCHHRREQPPEPS